MPQGIENLEAQRLMPRDCFAKKQPAAGFCSGSGFPVYFAWREGVLCEAKWTGAAMKGIES